MVNHHTSYILRALDTNPTPNPVRLPDLNKQLARRDRQQQRLEYRAQRRRAIFGAVGSLAVIGGFIAAAVFGG